MLEKNWRTKMTNHIEYATLERVVFGIANYIKTLDKKYLLDIKIVVVKQ